MASITISRRIAAGQGDQIPRAYSREAFRDILARQPEWMIRAALEEQNIPSCHVQEACEWLEEKATEFRQARPTGQH